MKTTLILTCALFVSFLVQSQEAVTVSGGKGTGTGGTSSYTLGQVFYIEATGGNGSISQGVQQSFELFTLSNPELTAVTLKAVTYPNPTTDFIILALTDADLRGVSYTMYDLLGRLVNKGTVATFETKIGMKSLPIGEYILRVQQNNQALKTFKIIKN